ncbi:MAG: tRNA (N(6)-L-threonylcarbamoyladenosine(37)-C(2))-methylthiotransferase MtaB [Treponema sp.]|nr:tRNA (N(6)-L-threonylcarbamoyladenosine(37)-C(2))-methylthiotransferase MtaB [Treponema sp.]
METDNPISHFSFLIPNFSIFTLGCKLNQLESEAIADSFQQAGFRLAPWDSCSSEPRIIIVNTCTVTSKADQKARRMIRKFLKDNPASCVIVTGCYAQLDTEEIMTLDEQSGCAGGKVRRLFVLGGGEGAATAKSVLLGLPQYLLGVTSAEPLSFILESWIQNIAATAKNDSIFDFRPDDFSFHSRGYLKIQDGCDNACVYCRVRLARGHSVSLNREAVLERLRAFESKGCSELFITGVNITQYSDGDTDLAGLLKLLLDSTSNIALRLSSLEPERIDERLASVLRSPRIRPHFHLSVQSGSDAILQRMGRVYNVYTVEKAIAMLRSAKDNPFLACDIIAGFPGETENEFAATFGFCERTRFAWIHAFPYSKRPNTAAFSFGDPVRDSDKTRRVEALGELALRGRREYTQAWLGKELSAVVEKTPCGTRQCRAVSENYLKLLVNCNGAAPSPGSIIRCTPVSLCEEENIDAIANEE